MQDICSPRGVPPSIALDGWWLEAAPEDSVPPGGAGNGGTLTGEGRGPRILGLLALVVLSDLLFWEHALGISVALFAAAVFAVATWDIRPRRALVRPALLLAAGAAPVVEYLQELSLSFLIATLICALIWARHPRSGLPALGGAALAFLGRLPGHWIAPLRPTRLVARMTTLCAALGLSGGGVGSSHLIRNWAFPLGGTLVFAGLLMDANPMLAQVFDVRLDLWTMLERGTFWTGIALMLAPFLSADLPPAEAPRLTWSRRLPGLGINAGSVLRALIMFNLMIGLQMGTDVSILLGGAALPAGMDYADYAHRGAYPLLATAILAGAFALAARPFLAEHRLIRPLMLLWLAQNVVLCGAAALRLDLYIGAYGLTYLRFHALIWMGLVAAGLALTAWQALAGRDTRWLMSRVAVLALSTLYVMCFVNVADIVARQNLARDRIDVSYVCSLGPMASGALVEALTLRPDLVWVRGQSHCAAIRPPHIGSWQEWGFRSWRVDRYVAGIMTTERLR